jgi:hypothetical protein
VQSDVLVPIGKENTADNSLTASPSSTVDEPHDATGVEDVLKTRSGKPRRRKRKRHGASPSLPSSQKSDMVRARMN